MECYFTTGYLKCNIPLNTGQKRKLPTHVCVFFMHATEGTLDCRWNHGPLGITPKTLKVARIKPDTVDGRNPAPADRWFIHVYPTIYRVSTIQGGAGFLPSTVCFRLNKPAQQHHQKDLIYYLCHVSAIMGRANIWDRCRHQRYANSPSVSKRRTVLPTYGSWASVAFLGGVFNPSQDFSLDGPIGFLHVLDEFHEHDQHVFLVGGWATPLKNISQLGLLFPFLVGPNFILMLLMFGGVINTMLTLWKNKKCSKPPTCCFFSAVQLSYWC